ncbi:uncharacterized protein LOC133913764 [Phragmites australis]|uniref:uncharacterized protein LOC133913764 n=1 Tax=Phragmites australis TaxID=29695 RepID=UPI002D79E883|nr:uncharacterized protein LOC133913764 [Phragmites australis]
MATRHGSRRTKADQWLFGRKWRGSAKETRHPVVSEVKRPNPITVQKDEGICLEQSRVHLPGLGQREMIDVAPGRKSMPEMETNMKEVDQWLFGGKWRGTAKETIHPVMPEAKPQNPTTPQKDEGTCLEKSRVHLHGLGQREIIDVAPGRKSMPEMEINMKEVVAVLGVKVMAADMPPFMQLHAFRCAKRSHDSLDKFSSRQLAHDVKKEFDKVYGPTWHCIVGTSYGSFVTHSRGCFLYFSMDKIIVMLFKTKIRKVLAS